MMNWQLRQGLWVSGVLGLGYSAHAQVCSVPNTLSPGDLGCGLAGIGINIIIHLIPLYMYTFKL